MTSFNHYAYGAVGSWLYQAVAGIDTREEGAGYKEITIRPHIGGGLTRASASLQTYYGQVASAWKLDGGKAIFDVEIPSNTSATIYLPAAKADLIMENDKPLAQKVENTEGGRVAFKVGSGKYQFSVSVQK